MIQIIDYGMGNLRSVQKAFEFLGFDAHITQNKNELVNASHIILPGVGAFADAAKSLAQSGMQEVMLNEIAKGKPFLGICLGMQLLFDQSFENGEHIGLSLVPGQVTRFDVTGLKVPHMGWNNLIVRDNALFDSEGADKYVYFVHSYHASDIPDEFIIGEADYGYRFTAAVQKDNVFGLQFHPEKSGDVGLSMLKRFGGLK
ncbi:MAG: imidazole glycerol phosphate synthase subunit HisH [Clostridia bacterium]|nr:imidazole glycerol phosphate synthase subunit HisH [Clostridia bacterium]MBT7122629.1 imidazole glycerol phosphate synthase subunit HisH [Clostridia bacterium]